MTNEHLRPLLDSVRDTHLLFLVAEQLARAQVPPSIVSLIRQGGLTALSKDDGGVRGIVAGGCDQASCGTHHGSAVVRSSEGRHRTFSVRPLYPGRVRVRGTCIAIDV